MRLTLNFLIVVVLSVGAFQTGLSQQTAPGNVEPTTGIATMFALDPLSQSLCFRDGGPGGVFQSGQTRNRCSDLNFNSYSANSFKVGIEGSRDGVIVDLGTPLELKTRYGFNETVGNGQAFASIDIRNGKALILKNLKTGELQELSQSKDLFRPSTDKNDAAQVKLGHVYLLRITDSHDKAFELLVKVLVLAYTPNESATVRWQVIPNNATAKR